MHKVRLSPTPEQSVQIIQDVLLSQGHIPTPDHAISVIQSIIEKASYPGEITFDRYVRRLVRYMSARWVEVKRYLMDTIYAIGTGKITSYKPLPTTLIKDFKERTLFEAKDFIIPEGKQNLIYQMMVDSLGDFKQEVGEFSASLQKQATGEFHAKQGNVATTLMLSKESFEKALADMKWQEDFVDNVNADTVSRVMELVKDRYPNKTAFKNYVKHTLRGKRDEMIGEMKLYAGLSTEKVINGIITPGKMGQNMKNLIHSKYIELYCAGKGVGPDNIDASEYDFIFAQAQGQLPYLDNFVAKMELELAQGKPLGNWVKQRANLYAERGTALYEAGWVSGLPADVLLNWVMQPAEHCVTCPIYESNSPYTKQTLPGFPGEGFHLTQCGVSCKCKLETYTPIGFADLTPQQQFYNMSPEELFPKPKVPRKPRTPKAKPAQEPKVFSELDTLDPKKFFQGTARIQADKDKVENQVMMVRTFMADNEQYYMVEFKSIDDKLTKDIMEKSGAGNLKFYKKDLSGNIPILGSEREAKEYAAHEYIGNGFRVIAIPPRDEQAALRNNIQVIVRGNDINELKAGLESFRGEFGLDPDFFSIPTEQARKSMYIRKLYTMFDPANAYDNIPERNDGDIETQLRGILGRDFSADEVNTLLAGIREYEVNNSYYTLKMPDFVTEKIKEKGGRFLTHRIYNDQTLPDILKSGLMSTKERWSRGIMSSGMSSATDIETGGADSVFVRLGVGNERFMDSSPNARCMLIIDIDEMARTDWYAYEGDRFGTVSISALTGRPDIFKFVENMQAYPNDSNELMFRNGINTKAIRMIAANEEGTRANIIHMLQAEGINEINGIAVEDFVKVIRKYSEVEW